NTGSLAIFAAIRRASSLVSSLAADRRPGSVLFPGGEVNNGQYLGTAYIFNVLQCRAPRYDDCWSAGWDSLDCDGARRLGFCWSHETSSLATSLYALGFG